MHIFIESILSRCLCKLRNNILWHIYKCLRDSTEIILFFS